MVLPNNTLKKMKLPRLLLLVVLAAVHADLACALNNGLGLVPPMG